MSRVPYSWQDPAWQQLIQRQQQGSLMQSLLITGLPGVGKHAFAMELAATGLCLSSDTQSCGTCGSCQQIKAGAHPDLLLLGRLEDKQEILIDQVREFCRQIQLTPSQQQGRYAIIHEADRLNIAAANALLKTLEEPPSKAKIILTADKLARLPATIRSRCSRIHIPCPSAEQASLWLSEHGKAPAGSSWARRRMGPCGQDDQLNATSQEQNWGRVLENLTRNHDVIAAAKQIDENEFDLFVSWWQEDLLEKMKSSQLGAQYRRLWDALVSIRRDSHGNFNRLLALEGLFILYNTLARAS